MTREPIPEDIRRFVLTSIPSVPYLEAMLLLRNDASRPWDAKRLAARLYVSENAAAPLLAELAAAGVLAVTDPTIPSYSYRPHTEELRRMIEQLESVYSKHIVEVTELIHSETSKTAQRFADAFKFRDDK